MPTRQANSSFSPPAKPKQPEQAGERRLADTQAPRSERHPVGHQSKQREETE